MANKTKIKIFEHNSRTELNMMVDAFLNVSTNKHISTDVQTRLQRSHYTDGRDVITIIIVITYLDLNS